LSLTPEAARPSRKPAVSLAKISTEEKTVEFKLKLVGALAMAFDDYRRAYQVAHGELLDPAVLAAHVLAAYVESDRAFAAWRRDNAGADGS
jgi:hypothetical protein